jgi:hypothetical protein
VVAHRVLELTFFLEGTFMHIHLGKLSAALVLVLASSGALVAGPAGADPTAPDPTVPAAADPGAKASAAGVENRAEQAEAALATVQAMFSGDAAAARKVSGSSKDLTIALRDLSRLKTDLSAGDRAQAEAFLARPTNPGTTGPLDDPAYTVAEATPVCDIHVCIHYVTSTADAVASTDVSPANLIPDFVDKAVATMELIHTAYVTGGYRAPKSDLNSANNGGDARTDIYLANMPSGYYGYCTSDDPDFNPPVTHEFDASAFCVLDNDYNSVQFPHKTPTQNLQATASHEYFHAVQFAYDIWEDSWLMEATATWVEDEVYDTINDNRQFLPYSPLSHPGVSLDDLDGTHEYGDWIFFRYLSERFPSSVNGLPTVVRDIWRRVDGAAGGPDQYSMQAVRNTVAARGAKFPAAFSRFAALNRHPVTFYEEGAAYKASPLAGTFGLSGSHRSTGWLMINLDHLTNAHARVKPSSTLTQSDWRLRINFDAPNTLRGSAAMAQVYKKNGSIAIYPITLNSSGDATKVFPFSASSVKYVEVTMTNASTRYGSCFLQDSPWSCFGIPQDQNLRFEFRATAFRA